MSTRPVPQQIKALEGNVSILWSDAHQSAYKARDLRLACRCAACVDEWTHEPLVNPDRVPPQLKPTAIEVVGNYALHFRWSDGHDTGIYTYDYLRDVCACDACRAGRTFNV
jgi:DUF971 family protein